MATSKNTSTNPEIPEDRPPRHLFRPLERIEKGAEQYANGRESLELARLALAVAQGAELVLEISERNAFEYLTDAPEPIFNGNHQGILEDLVRAACSLLAQESRKFIDDANSRARSEPEGSSA